MAGSSKQNTIRLSDIIRSRRNQILCRRGWAGLAIRIAFLALVFYIIFAKLFIVFQLNGNGMYPALKDGDMLIGFRLIDRPLQGDIVIFDMDGKNCVGRVVAIGGDTVQLDEDGMLRVNGTPESGQILFPTFAKDNVKFPCAVPDGQVFVLGDYRTQTTDSRDFGPISVNQIQGKLISFLRRRGL